MKNFSPAPYVCGHGVASGKNPDSRFPHGTLALQIPFFEKLGLDLSIYHQGTINLDLGKRSIELISPLYSFASVKWSEYLPAENFSFFAAHLLPQGQKSGIDALLYWPHPSTKPEFHQPSGVYEFIAPWVESLRLGQIVFLQSINNSFRIH